MKETRLNAARQVLCWNRIGKERWKYTLNLNSRCPKLGTHFESVTHLSSHVAAQWIPLGLILRTTASVRTGWVGKGRCSHNVYRGRLHSRMLWVPPRLVICNPNARCTSSGWHGQVSSHLCDSELAFTVRLARTQSLHFFFFFLNEVQSGALSLGHDGMLAAFLELLFCLTCVEAAVTLRMNKHTCGKAFHTLKPFQMAMSCWVGCLYAAPPLD